MPRREMTTARLEAFTDGVVAIIITIMVLELKVPAHELSNAQALRAVLPMLAMYLLSFVQVGIYWVNHHYMLDEVEFVSHSLLWSNLLFLFALSLIPFGTLWLGERGMSPFAIGLFAVCYMLPAVAWFAVSNAICRVGGARVASDGGIAKQIASAVLYLGAIPVAYASQALAITMLAAVAVIWLVPPKSRRQPSRREPSSGEHSR